MRSTLRYLSALTAVLVAGVALQTSVAAQTTRVLSAPSAISAAAQLESVADQQKTTTHDWIVSAQTLEKAARLRAPADPQGTNDLIVAAGVWQSLNRYNPACIDLGAAARRAEAANDNETAAHALATAANLSAEVGDNEMASVYLDQLVAVVHRPGVTPADRKAVLGPLGLSAND